MTNLKIGGASGVVNLVTPVVCDVATTFTRAVAVPPEEAHARELARQAERWIAYATERSRMTERTIIAKSLSSLAYSVLRGARSLALPSKLTGTKAHQRALWGLVRDGYRPFEALSVDTHTTDGIAVSLGDEPLGSVQPKHVPWARPLIPFDLRIYLARVTGSERENWTLGVNIVFGGVGTALDRLLDALGESVTAGIVRGHASGDGQTGAAPIVIPDASAVVPLIPRPSEGTTGDAPDIVLWRRIDGTACVSVPHAARHSPTGPEWGYVGAGPADLARSVLLSIAGEATADRLYHTYLHSVVAALPHAGGVLRADDVRRWIAAQDAPRPAA